MSAAKLFTRFMTRGGSRAAPRAARGGLGRMAGAGAAGAAGMAALNGLKGLGGSGSGGGSSSSGGVTPAGGAAGFGGGRFGMTIGASGFTPPSMNDNHKTYTANTSGDFEIEMIKLSSIQTNILSSIDNQLKNMNKLEVAKAQHDSKISEEASHERDAWGSGPGGQGGGDGVVTGSSGSGMDVGGFAKILGVGLGVAAAAALLPVVTNFLEGTANKIFGGPDGNQGSDAGGFNPSTPGGKILQGVGDALTGSAAVGDARRIQGRTAGVMPSTTAGGAAPVIRAANDNAAKAAGRLSRFFGILKNVGGRIPGVTTAIAAIDPLIALYHSGGRVDGEVKKQVVGALAMVLASGGGIALGAAIGTAVGSVVPGAGNVVGFLGGGLLGALAGLGAEFVAENLYDLIVGDKSPSEFMSAMRDGATNAGRRALGVTVGVVAGGARALLSARGAAAAGSGATASSAPAVAAGTRAGGAGRMAIPVPPKAVVATGAVTAGVVGLNALPRSAPPPTTAAAASGNYSASQLDTLPTNELESMARQVATAYLGRSLTDREWAALVRVTFAESGHNQREDAMIMASVLNRARAAPNMFSKNRGVAAGYNRDGLTVLAAIYAPSQFQAASGTKGNPGGSTLYVNGPNDRQKRSLLIGIILHLKNVSYTQTNFSAENEAAYGEGTNIRWLRDLQANSNSSVEGGTRFNTKMEGSSVGAPPPLPPGATGSDSPGSSTSPMTGGGIFGGLAGALGGFLGLGGNKSGAGEYEEGSYNASGSVDSSGWVVPTNGTVSSRMGRRSAGNHKGIDIAAAEGTPIFAAKAGTVTRAEYSRSYGNVVYVDHGDGLQTRYAHMHRLGVRHGSTVAAGQQIGTVGNTGRSRGNHLHFEVLRGGRQINPETIIPSLRNTSVSVNAVSQGGTITSAAIPTAGAMASGNVAGAPSTVAQRAENIVANATAASSSTRTAAAAAPVVIQTASNTAPAPQILPNAGANENPSSPVTASMAYAAYFGTA